MMRRIADAVLAALLAPPCAVCARVLDHPLDGAVCEHCWNSIGSPAPPFHGHSIVQQAAAIGEYDGVLREIVHALKYQGRRSAAPRLAQLMSAHGADVLAGADAVVPVPLHPQRERERGFNQADDLARGLGLPIARVLRRTRMTVPQVELAATARHANVKDAFAVVGRNAINSKLTIRKSTSNRFGFLVSNFAFLVEEKVLVLVDDVTTTGATLEACARVLKEAGAKEIRAVTAARVGSALR